MGRLVDIEDVKAFINGLDSLPWEEELDDLVKAIPTAYDVGKVVAELEENCGIYSVRCYLENIEVEAVPIGDAIDIVKRGGKNE